MAEEPESYASRYAHPPWGFVTCIVKIDRPASNEDSASDDMNKFRRHLERKFPILKQINFEYGIYGNCFLWTSLGRMSESTYEAWRCVAPQLEEAVVAIAKTYGLRVRETRIEPLPGPWRSRK